MSTQAWLIEAAALWLLLSSILLVRRRMMSIRYGLGWIVVSLCGLVVGPALMLLEGAIKRAGFTPTGFSLGIFVAFLGLVGVQLSISVSGQHRAVQNLSEHAAMLERRVAELEGHAARRELSGSER